MIFVVLGTHELPFKRLLTKMEQLIQSETITEKVVVQAGHTEFASERMEMIPFMSFERMNELYDQARVIVAHGGTGSIITGVKKNKPVIAVPRLAEYGEHNDNHQLEIVEQFRETGHIIGIDSPEKLDQALQQAETFRPVPFQSGRDHIMQLIEDFIDHS